MKTTIILALLLCLSFSVFCQHDFSFRVLPKIEFSTLDNKVDTNLFSINPQFKPDTIYFHFDSAEGNKNKKLITEMEQEKVFASQDNMPIVKPGSGKWNMPIAVPDTSVLYFIQNPMKEDPVPLVIKK